MFSTFGRRALGGATGLSFSHSAPFVMESGLTSEAGAPLAKTDVKPPATMKKRNQRMEIVCFTMAKAARV